jgi:hypothetical protein
LSASQKIGVEGMPEGPTHDPLKAQLRSDSGRSSKVIRDREGIEVVVEVPGAGELVLRVDSAGGFSVRGRPEGQEGEQAKGAARQVLLAVGVMRAGRIVTVRPEESPEEPPPSTSPL